MSTSVSIVGSLYTVVGTVKNRTDEKGIFGISIAVYDQNQIRKDTLLDKTTTDGEGGFLATFDFKRFGERFLDRKPDLYFIVKNGSTVLLDTSNDPIKNADESTGPILLWVDDFDSDAPGAGKVPAEGWVGGFAQGNPAFAYPNPDLASLPMLDNLANIPLLQRQQKVLWPEFSWLTVLGDENSRAYQMFAPDISRLGYTDEGRIYSIICPQQGTCFTNIGCMNVEVTVTGNRGWVDESDKSLAGDMTVVGKIWFSPSAHQNPIVKRLWDKFASSNLPFPSDKANAIQVTTYKPGDNTQPIFPILKGESTEFPIPDFAKHPDAWAVANLGVAIGPIVPTESAVVNGFNKIIMDIFNLGSGNMLKNGNTLTWNVWFIAPQHVDQQEWADHAEKWRTSIDADHGSPLGPGTDPRYFDGTPFKALKAAFDNEEEELVKELEEFEETHFG